jgi:hypothetical protein
MMDGMGAASLEVRASVQPWPSSGQKHSCSDVLNVKNRQNKGGLRRLPYLMLLTCCLVQREIKDKATGMRKRGRLDWE